MFRAFLILLVMIIPATGTAHDIVFTYGDPEPDPTGLTTVVDNSAGRLRVYGTANPHTSRFVSFRSNAVSIVGIKTIVFEADVSLPTGNRNGILSGTDPAGSESGGDSMGTPVFFQTSLGVQIALLGNLGSYLEQVSSDLPPTGELLSPNGGIVKSPILISTWKGGPAGFDPLRLIPASSVGSRFHVKLSLDLEKYKVMAEVAPSQGYEDRLNAMPGGCEGVIASPFIAITNLFDFTKAAGFDGSVSFSIAVRTNGNTDVDGPLAPGGTLRYIDREFTNVRVLWNEPIEFPTIPELETPFLPDQFDSDHDASQWLLSPMSGMGYAEKNGILELSGSPEVSGYSGFYTLCDCGRQDVTVEIDYRMPSGITAATHGLFRVWFDAYHYYEIDISQRGYALNRVADGIYESGDPTPLFGDEKATFHRLRISYSDLSGRIVAFVDNIRLDGIADKQVASSFSTLGVAFFAYGVAGDYLLYQWDRFASNGADYGAYGPLEVTVNPGGGIVASTPAVGESVQVGYAELEVKSGAAPYGTAVFSFRQKDAVISEAGVPASPLTTSARVFVEYRAAVPAVPGRLSAGTIDIATGIALANLGAASAKVIYTLRNSAGEILTTGHGVLPAGNQFACFVDQLKEKAAPDFDLPSDFRDNTQYGSLEISSDRKISVLALRGTNNQRNEFLMTTTPIADLEQPPGNGSIYFPQFVDGGGYTTSIVLLNTSDAIETGTLQILDDDGNPLMVNEVGGTRGSSFKYSILSGGVFRFQSDGFPPATHAGWVQLVPDAGTSTPIGSGVFGYDRGGVLVTETGIPSANLTTHARVYVDLSQNHNTGLAIANPSNSSSNIMITAFQGDGVTEVGTSQGPLRLGAKGHGAAFADQLITGLPAGFTGVLEVASATPFAALTLRSLNNERGDFLMATFPVADMNEAAPASIVFPHIVDGGGYETQFVFISAGAGSTGTLCFYDENGAALAVGKQALSRAQGYPHGARTAGCGKRGGTVSPFQRELGDFDLQFAVRRSSWQEALVPGKWPGMSVR